MTTPYKGRSGFDANGDRVRNIAGPAHGRDAIHQEYFVENNTIQPFSDSRDYPAGFLVERNNKIWKAAVEVDSGPWVLSEWTAIQANPVTLDISGNYTAVAGDVLLLTGTSESTITLPANPKLGDTVVMVRKAQAQNSKITVNGNGKTFNTTDGNLYFNGPDTVTVVYSSGHWVVARESEGQSKVITNNQKLYPNSASLVQTSVPITVTLPENPMNGQWVTVVDGLGLAGTNNITVSSPDNQIIVSGLPATSSYELNRNGATLHLMCDGTHWRGSVSLGVAGIRNTLKPLLNETIVVDISSGNKTVDIPSPVRAGDWVRVSVVTGTQKGVNRCTLSPQGGKAFRIRGSSSSSSMYVIDTAREVILTYSGEYWYISQTLIGVTSGKSLSGNKLIAESVNLIDPSVNGTSINLPDVESVSPGAVTIIRTSGAINIASGGARINGAAANFAIPADRVGCDYVLIYNGQEDFSGTAEYSWTIYEVGSGYLRRLANLSDLNNIATSRTNLGVYSKAEGDSRYRLNSAEVPLAQVTGLQAALDTKANKTIQVIAGTGLTGGGTLEANRTLSVSYGTEAGTAAQGNDSRITGAVQSAGTGLTKSGTSLSVTYGTAAGTAAQGNDSRLSNSREWSAPTMTQSEAEDASSTDRRAVTSQRIWQAVAKWFTGVITQGTGQSTTLVMSQKAVTDAIGSSPNTTYTAGNGLTLSGTQFSLPVTVSGSGTFVTGVTQTANGITVTMGTPTSSDTTYAAGTGLDLVGNEFSVKYGTAVGTAAQGNDSRITGAVQSAGTGLTKSGTSLSVTYGTAAGTAAQGNDSRIVNATPKTIQVIAGTGLTGGGTLEANRTLSVSYGTEAGTAAQGNDSRIVNAIQKSEVVQATGTSTTNIMSQKAVTDAIERIPSVATSSALTLALAHRGKCIDTTENVTVPTGVFSVGDVVSISVNKAEAITVTPASGVTLRISGSSNTGAFQLKDWGMVTLRLTATNDWRVIGSGIA